MTSILEKHYYIPPDVVAQIDEDGNIPESAWPDVYRLDNNYDRYLMSFTGMGMPPIEYLDQVGPNQAGRTTLKMRLQQRFIQYVHRRNAKCSRQDYWDVRADLINSIRPNRMLSSSLQFRNLYGRLRVRQPNGTTRDIDTLIQRGPLFAAKSPEQWDQWAITETLRFKCSDPTWYDPYPVETVWTNDIYNGLIFYEATNYSDHLTFPDNMLFGESSLSSSTDVTYTGTWFAYPIIYLTGPISSPTVENTTLGNKITLNYDVKAGEIVTIVTQYGRKSIKNNFGDNLIGLLSNDSDMDLYILPHPIALNGVNHFSVSGSSANVNTSVQMVYYTRFIGI